MTEIVTCGPSLGSWHTKGSQLFGMTLNRWDEFAVLHFVPNFYSLSPHFFYLPYQVDFHYLKSIMHLYPPEIITTTIK